MYARQTMGNRVDPRVLGSEASADRTAWNSTLMGERKTAVRLELLDLIGRVDDLRVLLEKSITPDNLQYWDLELGRIQSAVHRCWTRSR